MKDAWLNHTIIAVALITSTSALAQQRPSSPAQPRNPRQVRQQQAPMQPAGPLYQRRDTWYEFLLQQFNPDNFDYGTWLEQRRQAFLDASTRNPYFWYIIGANGILLLTMVAYTKLWIDFRRHIWVTAEMMADLYNHDAYSRQVAREAIRRYNDHIDRCNRAIEAHEHGTAIPGESTDADLKAELKRVADERNRYRQERDAANAELAQKAATLMEMSLRLQALSAKPGNGSGEPPIDPRVVEPRLVRHINQLQEELYTERQSNKKLKG